MSSPGRVVPGVGRAGVLARWVALTSQRERGTTLAVFRIAVSAVMFFTVASMATSGMAFALWVDVAHGGMRKLGAGNWLLEALGGPTPAAVGSLVIVALASAGLTAVGFGGRIPIIIALQSYEALITSDPVVIGGYDRMISNAMWLLFLGRATATLSVDCRLRSGAWRIDEEITAWPRYLVIFQQVVVYTTTGMHKLSATWTPVGGYSALYWIFQEPTWRRFDMRWTAWVYPVTQLATAVTWHWELAAPLLLLVYYYRATRGRPGRLRALFNRYDLRVPFAAVGVVLHLGILATLNVGPFSWISFAYYLCLWQPAEIERFAAKLCSRAALGERAVITRTAPSEEPEV